MSMQLTVENVETVLFTVLYQKKFDKDSIPDDAILVEGITSYFGFNRAELDKQKQNIIDMLMELPLQFRQNNGGGWSFLQACDTKDGIQWTGIHAVMEALFVLGIAIGKCEFLLERSLWAALPGSMPYIVIKE